MVTRKRKKSVPIQQQQLDSIKPSLACTFIYVHVIDQITENNKSRYKVFLLPCHLDPSFHLKP